MAVTVLQHRRLPFRRKESPDLEVVGALGDVDGGTDDTTEDDAVIIIKHEDMFDVEANEVPLEESPPLFALKPSPTVDRYRPSMFAVEPTEPTEPDARNVIQLPDTQLPDTQLPDAQLPELEA